ncbi:excalibur calcium-binding domain-containing protein [Bradyrhizobium iriomotense]|uniref:Excalibur calcium-binding domain-containing protein n=1 Tax=Bradyrhizobium iriomotense TaxID=441950 RepID=A0ABQ6B727_9BRAD|nr:excalibur calcium-binding domain-containing protein [Bradyrhizobium iriomotense]GLR88461.1 hypothetical protein GCM10007857_51730 [Bradyrhizobium iriomotense]
MRHLFTLAAAMAVFASPVMARGTIKAKTGDEVVADVKPGNEAKADASKPDIFFRTCREARAAGYSRMRVGEPGYARHLDRDNDGIACE